MAAQKKTPGRRSAREWARLVGAWADSGQSAKTFAAAHGIKPGTLSWWKWRLSAQAPTASEPDALHLVPVQVAPPMPSDASPAWELTSADGQVLRIYRSIAPEELSAVLSAMAIGAGRR